MGPIELTDLMTKLMANGVPPAIAVVLAIYWFSRPKKETIDPIDALKAEIKDLKEQVGELIKAVSKIEGRLEK